MSLVDDLRALIAGRTGETPAPSVDGLARSIHKLLVEPEQVDWKQQVFVHLRAENEALADHPSPAPVVPLNGDGVLNALRSALTGSGSTVTVNRH